MTSDNAGPGRALSFRQYAMGRVTPSENPEQTAVVLSHHHGADATGAHAKAGFLYRRVGRQG